MRFAPGLGLLLLLQIGNAAAQSYDEAPSSAQNALDPVRTVLAESEGILDDAIREASFDGTADEAAARAAFLQGFVQGLSARPRWPSGSAGEATPADPFDLAVSLANVVDLIANSVGFVERNQARCDAWSANATFAERIQWGRESWPARSRMFLLQERLTVTADALDDYLDVTPLHNAITRLEAWLDEKAPAFQDCLPAPDEVFLILYPSTIHPTGLVQAHGGMGKPIPGAAARLQNPRLGLDTTLTINTLGTFSHSFRVPLTTPLGPYTTTATFPNRTATADLNVVQATSRLLPSYPVRVQPGATITVTARVETPILERAPTGPVSLAGSLAGTQNLDQGRTTFTFQAPNQPTNLTGTVHYPGDALQLPADALYHIRVRLTDAPDAPEPPTRVHRVLDLELDLAALNQLLLLGPLLFLVFLAADLMAGRQARRLPTPVTELTTTFFGGQRRRAFAGAQEPPSEAFLPRFLQSFLGFFAWLIRSGEAKPSMTAREAAQRLKAYGANPDPIVSVFERVRYGDAEAPPRIHGLLPRWIRLVWDRIRGR